MQNTSLTRVLVVDDDPLVRDAYRSFLAAQEGFSLVGEARDGAEAVSTYGTVLPDVVLMDLQMPGMSGIDATAAICQKWPDACIVVLTTFGSREYIVAALRVGAAGYLVKDSGARNLVAGIRQAQRGDMPLSASIRRQLVESVTTSDRFGGVPADIGLTPREVELLGWLTQGMTNYQIGRHMFVSEGSVKQYLAHIGAKMNVKSRTQILIKAIQLNIVDPREVPVTSTPM